jgi:RNase H-fold protein (predicted Holliday junction resolvase)
LGIDPGTRKAGYAVVGPDGGVLAQGIEEIDALPARAEGLIEAYGIDAIALGKGTNVEPVRAALSILGRPIHLVDERETTLRARKLYFSEHPPRGWRRLIPLGLQLPPRPIDDYAAILIVRRYLERGNTFLGTS